jgi:hypothetical protein
VWWASTWYGTQCLFPCYSKHVELVPLVVHAGTCSYLLEGTAADAWTGCGGMHVNLHAPPISPSCNHATSCHVRAPCASVSELHAT